MGHARTHETQPTPQRRSSTTFTGKLSSMGLSIAAFDYNTKSIDT